MDKLSQTPKRPHEGEETADRKRSKIASSTASPVVQQILQSKFSTLENVEELAKAVESSKDVNAVRKSLQALESVLDVTLTRDDKNWANRSNLYSLGTDLSRLIVSVCVQVMQQHLVVSDLQCKCLEILKSMNFYDPRAEYNVQYDSSQLENRNLVSAFVWGSGNATFHDIPVVAWEPTDTAYLHCHETHPMVVSNADQAKGSVAAVRLCGCETGCNSMELNVKRAVDAGACGVIVIDNFPEDRVSDKLNNHGLMDKYNIPVVLIGDPLAHRQTPTGTCSFQHIGSFDHRHSSLVTEGAVEAALAAITNNQVCPQLVFIKTCPEVFQQCVVCSVYRPWLSPSGSVSELLGGVLPRV
jgi:hypothetical protein